MIVICREICIEHSKYEFKNYEECIVWCYESYNNFLSGRPGSKSKIMKYMHKMQQIA